MHRYLKTGLCVFVWCFASDLAGTLAGGRPNAFSEGQNAFAGVVNPANAVWLKDRVDVGGYWTHQQSSLKNRDGNPNLPLGFTDTSYRAKNMFMGDAAAQKAFKCHLGGQPYECSFTLATYTTPSTTYVRTKYPFPSIGVTPLVVYTQVRVYSGVLSCKFNQQHALGVSLDVFQYIHRRNGFQRADTPLRSVSPGHVTNNGYDRSSGVGVTLGWRWNITEKLCFGAAWIKKSYGGQYRKYRGYEPRHARNYLPQGVGAGFRYRFSSKVAGRLEVVWSNFGNTPAANDNFLSGGVPNTNLRGSKQSPGPGLQDATFLNAGLGVRWNEHFSTGVGVSHRFKVGRKNRSFLSHTYTHGTIYELISLGANYKYGKHDFFFSLACGLKNSVTGDLPLAGGGGRMTASRRTCTCSLSWGYLY